jgi:hypothetical protein
MKVAALRLSDLRLKSCTAEIRAKMLEEINDSEHCTVNAEISVRARRPDEIVVLRPRPPFCNTLWHVPLAHDERMWTSTGRAVGVSPTRGRSDLPLLGRYSLSNKVDLLAVSISSIFAQSGGITVVISSSGATFPSTSYFSALPN